MGDRVLLSLADAAALLGVSRTTFNKIRIENNLSEVMVGKRARFYKDELLAALKKKPSTEKSTKSSIASNEITLNIFSNQIVNEIETKSGVFDLTLLKQIDPYGALSLLCVLIVRTRLGQKTHLLVNEGVVCQTLKAAHFFYQAESECGSSVTWDKKILEGKAIEPTDLLVPIKAIKVKGAERTIAESLITLLRKQGFEDALGRGIAQIIGELADNAMTHSAQILSDRVCFVSAQRYIYKQKKCIVVGLADPGSGIHSTLKSSAKYSHLSDKAALIQAFRPYVTSWEAKRGKGLTDVLGIALGNKSYLRVDSGPIGLLMDFYDRTSPLITFKRPIAETGGTRFGLVLIDNDLERSTREEVNELLICKAAELV